MSANGQMGAAAHLDQILDAYFSKDMEGLLELMLRAADFRNRMRDDIGDPGVHDVDPAFLNPEERE